MKLNITERQFELMQELTNKPIDNSSAKLLPNPVLAAVPCTYVLTVSEFFPKTHNKGGLPTGFINAISNQNKIHTIRGNYDLWAKRAEKINKGEAVLSVRYWTGKPYNSKQREVFVFEKIGIEKLIFDDYLYSCQINGKRFSVTSERIAENDGLNMDDFENWFKGYDFSKPMAIIHFSEFRYCR